MRLRMLVASELATHGSVIAKHERVLPSSSGSRNCSRWSGVANFASGSMFPVSGAEQLVASCDSGDWTHELAQRRVLQVGEPGAVLALGEEQVPQAAGARLRLQLLHHRRVEVRIAGRRHLLRVHRLGRIDALAR